MYMNVQVPSNITIDDRGKPQAWSMWISQKWVCGFFNPFTLQECPDNHTFVNNCQVRFLTKIYHPNIDKVRWFFSLHGFDGMKFYFQAYRVLYAERHILPVCWSLYQQIVIFWPDSYCSWRDCKVFSLWWVLDSMWRFSWGASAWIFSKISGAQLFRFALCYSG